jgi:hypothetical protein
MDISQLHHAWGIKTHHIHSDQFTGYEPYYGTLSKFTKQQYQADPAGVTQQVLDIYRQVNLVPIVYYTQAGIANAIREFKQAGCNPVQDQRIGLGNNQGQSINRFLFPNMMTAEPKGRGSNSLKDRFLNDDKLRRAIKICFEFRDGENLVSPTAVRRALELVSGENVQNFKPQNARAIAEHLCPVMWGRVYDYSCGYGGRLLGVSASRLNYQYVGVDPNTQTFQNLNHLNQLLGSSAEIICSTSQEYQPENIDLAFSSPPYFNLEKYCDEPTQCMVQFTSLDDWFDGYVVPTMQNIHQGLNADGVFATNIADYKSYGNKQYQVVDRWIQTAEKLGFQHTSTIKMMLNTRPGVGNDKMSGREKYEGVYVFKK